MAFNSSRRLPLTGDRGGTASLIHPIVTNQAQRLSTRTLLLGTALVWFVVIGGTELGSVSTTVRTINAMVGAAIIGVWLWRLPRRADATDLLVLGALIAFLIACVASDFLRMSYEAATSALAYAAAFSVARWEVADRRSASALITVMAVLTIGFLLLFLPVWVLVWREWTAITEAVPPLDLRLPVGPYNHIHTVAMLLALLLPALFQMTQRRLMNVVAYAAIGLSLALVYMAGSRTVWLALALGVIGPMAALRARLSKRSLVAFGFAILVTGVLVVSGVLDPIVRRLSTTSTIDLRFEIWGNSLRSWLSDPLFGTGPGSFSAAFTLTDYFDRYENVGRHADSAIVQQLMEAGLLGFVTFALLASALIVGIRRANGRWTQPAMMGLSIFGFMSLTNNPSAAGYYLIPVGLCWAALCTPAMERRLAAKWTPSWRTAAIGLTAVVIAGSTLSLKAASAAFDASQHAATWGDHAGTIRELDRAIGFDPGHALYWRARGLHRASQGVDGAVEDLRQAIGLNPADTVAMRALAVLHAQAGEDQRAMDLARRAAGLRATHEENLVTLAFVASITANGDELETALIDVVRRFPWITASPEWAKHFPDDAELERLLVAADDAWSAQRETSARFAMPQVWLKAATGGSINTLPTPSWVETVSYLRAIDGLLRCEIERAADAILEPPPRTPSEADLIAMISTATIIDSADQVEQAIALADLRGVSVGSLARVQPEPVSPFWDPGEDRRLYERDAVVPVDLGITLPTANEGLSAWLMDPWGAARVGAPGSGLAGCEPPGH